MKAAVARVILTAIIACIAAAPVRAQLLLDDWLVRTSATPDALIGGATAVVRNPAMLAPAGRGEAHVVDVRGPDVTGITGFALAGSYRLDNRTSVGAAYQHVGVNGVEQTQDAPDTGTALTIGQDLFALGASHSLSHVTVGANAQYIHSAPVLNQASVVRLGLGVRYALPASIPVTIAADAQNENNETMWAAGARVSPRVPLPDWALSAAYGASGGGPRNGVTHRITGDALWRGLISIQAGAVSDPESAGHVVTAIGSLGVRVNRYELGIVRESLAHGFGAVHSFRFGYLF